MTPAEAIPLAVGLIAIIGAVLGWLKWLRPKIRRGKAEVVAVRDAILGRDAISDSITGREIEPPLPGVGVRVAHVEESQRETSRQIESIAVAITKLASQQEAIEDHEARIEQLEKAAVERIVTKQESAQAWRAMEAAANAQPDDEEGEVP